MIGQLLRRVRGGEAAAGPPPTARTPFSYGEAIAFLGTRGVSEEDVWKGTIPEDQFPVVAEAVRTHLPPRPLRALHIGNYLGLSLAALSDIVIEHDPKSVVVSIDPNLPHHGVHDPQSHVLALLDRFGMAGNNVVICGYSMERVENRTQVGTFADQPAGVDTLESLERLGHRFDLAFIDGNHGRDYVRGELAVLVRLLSEGGLVVLDDVFNEHVELPELYEEVLADDRWPFEKAGENERLGILRVGPTSPAKGP